ncbi:MAG: phosphoribosylanthranilate isomerase [Deltaproteobacteria bacterium]|nr:phosphoribosylanthranilate isomerase [Deltaproteobacteria bacterium]
MVCVKICCIQSVQEAELAVRHGAHAIGFVSSMPSGTGMLPDEQIRDIAARVPGARHFLLTAKQEVAAIAEQVREAGTDTVQLVDRMAPAELARLRREIPEVSLVQVVHVVGPDSISEARQVEPHVDAILLDSGQPDAPDRTLGGTGLVHDWGLSAQIVRSVSCPVFLAGGLDPDNVGEAIRRVRPYGVDVCSRLRPQGELDERLLSRFFEEVGRAAAEVRGEGSG